jgi:Tfp pilus assembly protein PilF
VDQAAAYLQTALRLDPENQGCRLVLGQLQIDQRQLFSARQTLLPLLKEGTEPKIRAEAEKLLRDR